MGCVAVILLLCVFSIEKVLSGPTSFLSNMKCFSMAVAPKDIAVKEEILFIV